MNRYTFESKNPHFSRQPSLKLKLPLAHTSFHMTINTLRKLELITYIIALQIIRERRKKGRKKRRKEGKEERRKGGRKEERREGSTMNQLYAELYFSLVSEQAKMFFCYLHF